MDKVKQIFSSITVALITVILMWNTQREIPPDERDLYANYIHSYWFLIFLSIALLSVVNLLAYKNRLIESCYITLIGVCISMCWKSLNHTLSTNNYYDITLIGLFMCVSLIYFIKPFWKDLLTLFKGLSNQIYMACQQHRMKGKKD